MMAPYRRFTTYDFVIFAVNITLCAGIGIYHAFSPSRNDGGSLKQFFVAGHKVKVLPLTISLVVSVVSAVTFLGLPAEMYQYGTQYFFNFGSGLGIVLTAFIFVPLLHPLKLTSMFEYLEKRFNSRSVRLCGSILEVFSLLLYGGAALFAPATALEGVTRMPAWSIALAMGALVTFYTALGGLRAVIWTDILQAFIMVAGVIAVIIQGSLVLGGFDRIWEANKEGGRLQFYDYSPDPRTRHTFWGLSVGFAMGGLSFYGASQFTFQRFSSTETVRQAKITVLLNLPAFYFFHILLCGVGLVIYAFYHYKECDPLENKEIASSNQLLPYFVMDIFGHLPGLPGLFVAALTSGALSTISSILNSVAALVWEDLLKDKLHFLSQVQATWVVKCIVVVCGVLVVSLSFLADNFGPHIFQVSFAFLGATGGPQLGMFLLGALIPWVNKFGAISGCLAGIVMTSWITLGKYITRPFTPTLPPTSTFSCPNNLSTTRQPYTNIYSSTFYPYTNTTVNPGGAPQDDPALSELYKVSYTWYTTIGVVTCLLVGLVVSKITGGEGQNLESSPYVLPWYRNIKRRLCACRSTSENEEYTSVATHVKIVPKELKPLNDVCEEESFV